MAKHQTRPMLSAPELSGLPLYLSDRHALWLSPARKARPVTNRFGATYWEQGPSQGRTTWVQGQLTYLQCTFTVVDCDSNGTRLVVWGSTPVQPDPLEFGRLGHGSPRVGPEGYGTMQFGLHPWHWNPYPGDSMISREGEPIFENRNPRAHTEGVGWCRTCGEVARTSPEITHHWRCTKPDLVGCKIPAVYDGPNVLMQSIKVHRDDRGREYLLGAAFNGTGAATISEQTPELWPWERNKRARREPAVTLGHVDFWSPAQPVAWITTKAQPHERHSSLIQEGRYVMQQATARWINHANAGSMNMEPRVAERWWKEHYPGATFIPDTASIQKEYDALKSWAKETLSTALEPAPVQPDVIQVHRDGILKADLTPYTGNRGPRQIIAKQSADSAERRLQEDRRRKDAAREAARKMLEDGAIG